MPETTEATTTPIITNQETALRAAERRIHRHAAERDADDLVDILRVEVASGVPIKEALNGIMHWNNAEQGKPPTSQFTPGFALTPVELLRNKTFMEGFNHTGRVMLVLLAHSSGGVGEAFLSNRRLMDETFIMDEQSVVRAKNKLKEDGRIFETGRIVGRGIKVIRINMASSPHKSVSLPLTNRFTDPSQIGLHKRSEEKILKKTTTPTPPKLSASTQIQMPIQNNQSGGGFSLNVSEEKPQPTSPASNKTVPESITTIVNGKDILGANKTTMQQISSLFAKHQLPDEVMEGMIRTTAEVAEAGGIRTTADRYIGGLIGRYRDGAYVPEAEVMRETATEKNAKLAKARKAEEADELKEAERQANDMAELDAAKKEVGEVRVGELRTEYIANMKKTGSILFAICDKKGFEGPLFEGNFNGFLRQTLLTNV
jgi:hypothetical protein